MSSFLYLWQFPHFFALAWMYKADYTRGGYQMVPCNDPSGARTAGLILRYSLYLAPLPIIAAAADVTSWMFAVEGSAMNAVLLFKAWTFYRERSNAAAKGVFRASLWYLPAALALFLYHSNSWGLEDALPDESELRCKLRFLKQHLKAACVHEMLTSEEGSSLCPVVVVEGAAEGAAEAAGAAAAEALSGSAAAAAAGAAPGSSTEQQAEQQ